MGVASGAIAGPIEGSGHYLIWILDDAEPEPNFLVDLSLPFFFTGERELQVDSLGILEGEVRFALDPDPVASYRLTINNTTGGHRVPFLFARSRQPPPKHER